MGSLCNHLSTFLYIKFPYQNLLLSHTFLKPISGGELIYTVLELFHSTLVVKMLGLSEDKRLEVLLAASITNGVKDHNSVKGTIKAIWKLF